MLDWLRDGNRIRPTQYTDEDAAGFKYFKAFLILVLYMYCLFVMAIYDFTISGLIAAVVIPVLIAVFAIVKTTDYVMDMPNVPVIFFISTIVFYFVKNIVIVISGISELFYTNLDNVFQMPAAYGIIFGLGFALTMIKRRFWMLLGFAVSGVAVVFCIFGYDLGTDGGKFLLVYGVFIAAYIIILSLSEGYYNSNKESYGEKSAYAMSDSTRLMNIILLLLTVIFAVVNKTQGCFLDWEHIDRFISIAFCPAIMFPLAIAFCIYYAVTDHIISTNIYRTQDHKRVKADRYYTVLAMMMYILCCVTYKYYFTFNFLILAAFIAVLFLKLQNILSFVYYIDINAVFFTLLIADIMIATGRTGTAIVICLCVFILNKYYWFTYGGMTIHSGSDKVLYEPKSIDVYIKMLSKKSFWILCIGEITAVTISMLLHVKTSTIAYGSFIGSIGAPDIQLILVILICAGVSVFAVFLFFYRSYAYRPKYTYLAVVLALLFVACTAVVKKDAPTLRVDADADKLYVTCNINESDMDTISVYRGSSLPFMASYYSPVTEDDAPPKGYMGVRYPECDSELCERMEFMVLDKNGKYTSYVCYYPLALSSFIDAE